MQRSSRSPDGGEVTALALTLEKSREASGCPAGVDLQDWVKKLAEENVGLTQFITQRCYVFDGEQHEVSDAYICATDGGIPETPATDAYLAGVKADSRIEGAHFVANRMLAAWDAGFIEDSATNAADIARMILTSTKFMADAPEGDFDRSFADGVLEYIAAQLRKGADK
ncbi:ead/Ea22-like family protein [Klebsiella aerogenes]